MSSIDRRKRLASLTKELEALEQRLAERETPADALEFLDLLVRCESFPSGELQAAESGPLLKAAAIRRGEHASTLGALAARAVDPEKLLEQTFSIIDEAERGAALDTLDWSRDLLRLANVTPYLDEPARDRAAQAIEEILNLIEANPFAFVDTADLAKERSSQEFPQGIRDTLGMDLLRAFKGAAELAASDGETAGACRGDRPRFRLALADGPSIHAPEVMSRFASVAKAGAAWTGEPLRLAAASKDYGIGEHALLQRTEEGELVLTRIGGSLFVDWYGEGAPELAAAGGGPLLRLEPQPIEDGLRWKLPETAEALRLEARIGEKRIDLVIPA